MNPKRVIVPVVALLGVAVALRLTLFGADGAEGTLEASGTVEATDAQLGFQAAGRVEAVRVREGDRVRAGEELATLERAELEARGAQAQAQLAAARALLAEMETGARSEEVAQAREGLRAASERSADARRDLERTERLVAAGALSQEALDKARLALEVAESQRDQAAQQAQLVETGPRPERIAAQRALVAQAEAAVRQADAALDYAVIRAPWDGVVTVRDREPGETVGAGAPVLTIMNLDDRWVRIYIREDRIGAVRLGQDATITADTYPGRTYRGAVAFISSEAEFTPRNVQTTEERVRLVYAVKVRIGADPSYDLKPGVPADVRLH
ncbi:MAG: HlyD family efflux transporter periplasmic adaptor subunit [Gemmatimonadetes bacterium]|nr:HlyD family efflux transporter periplasmic adaptor subunit [Gemmatimonadota bacterium]